MTRRLDRLRGVAAGPLGPQRGYSFDAWLHDASSLAPGLQTTWGTGDKTEALGTNFEGYVRQGYKRNGVVFSVILARLLLFTQARFQWQHIEAGRPGDLFDDDQIRLLERPWTNATTADLLAHMEQDASLAGNSYTARRLTRHGEQLRRLRPDRVQIVLGTDHDLAPDEVNDLTADVAGYLFWPKAVGSGKPIILMPEDVAHYAPIPDPDFRFRGMSWLTPVIEEIRADTAATLHKGKFFDNAATPNLAVSLDKAVNKKDFLELVAAMREHEGAENAYRTLWLAGGADVKVVGADLKQLDFKVTQGAGETRIASAGGVPPLIAGLSEGLGAATYSNYAQARRAFGDLWAQPAWAGAAGALESIRRRPSGASRLWFDADGIAYLQEDQKDEAEIVQYRMTTIKTAVDAGFTADSVVAAVVAGDLRKLEHSGLFSVQLQPVGTDQPAPTADPAPAADPVAAEALSALDAAIWLQRSYLAVGKILTTEEARALARAAGIELPDELPAELLPPAADPAAPPADDPAPDAGPVDPDDDPTTGDAP